MVKRKLTKQQINRIHLRRKKQRMPDSPTTLEHDPLAREQEGLVISHFGAQADVETADGCVIRCHLRANLGDVASGDRVLLRPESGAGVIEAIRTRDNELLRPDSYGNLKIVAANVTRAVVTIAPEPEAHANLIDRYLVVAEALGIEPILVVNKADLMTDNCAIQSLCAFYKALGYKVHCVSAKLGIGMQALKAVLAEGTSVFVGQSGVGKSSLVQTLLPAETIKIGKLSSAVRKGRHTTTHATFYHFDFGGHCIDSPGIREFGLWHMSPHQVAEGFIEFRKHIEQCRFRNCRHESEPGCMLQKALAEGAINPRRFASYRSIVDSLTAVTIHSSKV